MISIPVITIDGPSGTGKGTIARKLAQRLGWHMLDSGVLYRVLGLAAIKHQVGLDNAPALEVLAAHLDLQFQFDDKDLEPKIILEGENVADKIRTEEISQAASKVSALAGVRKALIERQRAFRELPGLVTDGRDMGTVIFPDAPLKIFLTAGAEERAKRRYKQLKEKGIDANMRDVLKDLTERDERDRNRTIAPLKPAEDAFIVDTTHLSVDAALQVVMKLVEERLSLGR